MNIFEHNFNTSGVLLLNTCFKIFVQGDDLDYIAEETDEDIDDDGGDGSVLGEENVQRQSDKEEEIEDDDEEEVGIAGHVSI